MVAKFPLTSVRQKPEHQPWDNFCDVLMKVDML
jgi:hypothetical protein